MEDSHMHKFMIFCKLLLASIAGFFTDSHYNIHLIDTNKPSQKIIEQLKQFETTFVYPFSKDEEFTIIHGSNGNYFSFFNSLGKPYYYVAFSKENKKVTKKIDNKKVVIEQKAGEIAGAGCAILRIIKDKQGQPIPAWYLCDLKVNPKYQGEHLPITMVKKFALSRFTQCSRGFAICMNPVSGDPKAASIFKKNGPIQGLQTQTLNLYSLSLEQFTQHQDYLQTCLCKHGYMKKNEKLGFKFTTGKKDYNIRNTTTGQCHAWDLVHIKPIKALNGISYTVIPHTHVPAQTTYMICAVGGTPLDDNFKHKLGPASSTAQIVSYGMEDVDFNFLTSDQI